MALYTRVEYEAEERERDQFQAKLNGMLAREEIDPWDFNACVRENERLRARAHNKLVASRLIIEDRVNTEKSLLFAWVIISRKKVLCKWAGWGRRGFVTMEPGWEGRLVYAGKTENGDTLYRHPDLGAASIMEIKSGRMRKKVPRLEREMQAEVGGEMYWVGAWMDVPREEAKRLQDSGVMVWWDRDMMVKGVWRAGETAKVKREMVESGVVTSDITDSMSMAAKAGGAG